MSASEVNKSRLSLADEAVSECYVEGEGCRESFAKRCHEYLDKNNAEALDYAMLNAILSSN